MAQHKVKFHQNIFDVAIELYGSIEGLYDLLISNRWLSMETELTPGMVLEYHEYFVLNDDVTDEIAAQGYKVANGERHVYHKSSVHEQVFQIDVPAHIEETSFAISGEGDMEIDWGDNSDMEVVHLSHTDRTMQHFFDNFEEKRVIKIYGDFSILKWDVSAINGQIYTISPIVVDEFVCQANDYPIEGLLLFEGTVRLDLSDMFIKDLSPIYDMSLQELDLRGAHINTSVIDAYLMNIVDNYEDRRNCTVYLTTEPGEDGMEAIQTIISEPSWNESGPWTFDINGTIYTYTE